VLTRRTAATAVNRPTSSSLDRVGTYAGLLCAIHCGLLGLAPAAVAVLGVGSLMSSSAEWIAVGVCSVLALCAAVFGFRRHRNGWVPVLFALSIFWMLGTRWLEHENGGEPWFAVVCALGGVAVAGAHIANRRCRYDHAHSGSHAHEH
jgi:uncharacterized membrane protein YuzA (DUF378 family)